MRVAAIVHLVPPDPMPPAWAKGFAWNLYYTMATPENPKWKPKEDRVREGITILQKLQEVGIGRGEPAFHEIQTAISEWVNTGFPATKTILIPRYGRTAHLILPRIRTAIASLALKSGNESS